MKNLKNNNKGFSLVELIVVIAIMVVLAVALAPVFTKFVGDSRRATDVTNATTIAEAILVEVADNSVWYQDYTDSAAITSIGATGKEMTTIKSWPTPQGDIKGSKATSFSAKYVASDNKVEVNVTANSKTYNLADPKQAQNYKDQKDPDAT